MSISPRAQHALEQFLALNLEVQAQLRTHREALIAAGWSAAEAWALCQRVEERVLGPAMDLTESVLKVEARIVEEIRREMGMD